MNMYLRKIASEGINHHVEYCIFVLASRVLFSSRCPTFRVSLFSSRVIFISILIFFLVLIFKSYCLFVGGGSIIILKCFRVSFFKEVRELFYKENRMFIVVSFDII